MPSTSAKPRNFSARTAAVAAIAVAVAAQTGFAAGASGPSARPAAKSVTVGDDFFSPTSFTIKQNKTVKWSWSDTDNKHKVKTRSAPESFSSKKKSGNYSYSHKFDLTGTYKIYCTVHPDDMKMTIKVKKPN